MILCLVTDRRRLGAAIGARPAELIEALETQVGAAAEAGIDFVQIREPDLDARALTQLVRSLIARCRGSATRMLVNERLDVAIAAGAHGVHLKESSIAPGLARFAFAKASAFAKAAADGPADRAVVSCAVHTPLTATARHSADLLIAGTVLPTVSKPRTEYLDWKGLQQVVGAAKGTPVLGIGGLDLESIPSLAATGAAGLAAIGAFIPTAGVESEASGLKEFVKKRVTDMRFVFDSAPTDP
jgi:thiamine-phosphate diphosphorylase